jgi:hypothetical protein
MAITQFRVGDNLMLMPLLKLTCARGRIRHAREVGYVKGSRGSQQNDAGALAELEWLIDSSVEG